MTNEPLAPMLRKLGLWSRLGPSDEQALLQLPHELVTVGKYRSVVGEDEVVTHCWLLLSGFVVRYKTVGDGGRQIVSIHMMGDLVDLQNAFFGASDHGILTLTECHLAKIPTDAVRHLSDERPAVKDALWIDTLVDGSIYREWVANVGRRSASTRIAHLLCEFAVKLEAVGLGERMNYELPMTQEQLADATGLTPVHVNRALKGLERSGLIERATARSVVIGDWKKLAAAGDFRPNYLHLDAAERRANSH